MPRTASAAATAAIPIKAPTTASVTLPTGEKVSITTTAGGNQSTYSIRQGASPVSGQFSSYQAANGDHYVIPAEAVPYLGRQLSPSLFDVTALQKAGSSSGGKVPVSLGFAVGSTPAAPPGVTLTSASGQSAQGYLTTDSGSMLGAGLRAAIGADVRAGRQPGASRLFGGLTSLSLAGAGGPGGVAPGTTAPAPQSVLPLYKMFILQVNVLDLSGLPTDSGLIFLVNTDSVLKEETEVPTGGGVGRIAVPAGHYALASVFSDYDSSGTPDGTRMVMLADFTVAASAAATLVTVDERTASNKVSFSTPRPATQDYIGTDWIRMDAAGAANSFSAFNTGSDKVLFVNSQPVAKTGKVRLVQSWGGAGTGAGAPYRYDLAVSADRIAANQAFAPKASQLATVDQDFYHDPAFPQSGTLGENVYDPTAWATFFMVGTVVPAGPLTQYLSSGSGIAWIQDYQAPDDTQYLTDAIAYAAGKTYAVDWGHGPLAPNGGAYQGPLQFQPCLGCANGSDMSVGFNRIGDSDPEHAAFSDESTDYTIYLNGTQYYTGGGIGVEMPGLPSGPDVIRQVVDTDASGTGDTQSVTTHTDVTFDYTPGQSGPTAPSSTQCDFDGVVTSPCQILPVLYLGYNLLDDAQNTGVPGVQTLDLTVNHLSYSGHGSTAAITSATVSVSFDDGRTWQPATMLGSGGTYTATWITPQSAVGTSPDLKVTATDAIGGSITQTVDEAYTVAAAATTPSATPASATAPGVKDACGQVPAGDVRCLAEINTSVHGGEGVRGPAAAAQPGGKATTLPDGLSPAQLEAAYKLPRTGGANQTVALVDAGDDPTAEADLAVYRATYGLPACTTANACFTKVDQQGTAGPLPPDQYWDVEIALDLDMVSASCPDCRIMLMEADSEQDADLAASVDTAVSLGATEVSNSYGGDEANGMQAYAADYTHPGVAIVAASGDDGYGIPLFPAVLSTVIAAGGTTLTPADNARGWTETAWSQAGSGCSAWIAKPSWQKDKHCPGRTTADVSADADPNTGPAIYDTDNDNGGWSVIGGTSASSPFIAGVIGLAGNPGKLPNASYLYAHTGKLNDVVGGNNAIASSCGTDYLCNAVKGYDGPTGNGSPNGTAAF